MKKLILIAAFLLLGIAANAQSNTPQIDTSDATIRYLLDRIEALEHKVNFEADNSSLNSAYLDLVNQWNDIRTSRIPKKIVKEYVEAFEKKKNLLTIKISYNAVRYKYSDEELNVLDSFYELINIKMKMFQEWLNN